MKPREREITPIEHENLRKMRPVKRPLMVAALLVCGKLNQENSADKKLDWQELKSEIKVKKITIDS